VKQWERLQNNPEEHFVENAEEGIRKLKETRSVFHGYEGMIKGFFR